MIQMILISSIASLLMGMPISNSTVADLGPCEKVDMKKPVQSENPHNENADREFWTEERLKSAEPIELPSPKKPAPVDENGEGDSDLSISGQGNTGSDAPPEQN